MTTIGTFVRKWARPGEVLADPIVPTRFSSPVTARVTDSNLR